MKIKLAILFLGMLFIACNSGVKPAKNADTLKKRSKALSNFPEPKWLDSPRLVLAIDTNLTHKRTAFRCDSVIIMSYNGSFGENFYLPVNEKGQWINTIKKKKKLSAIQFKKLNAR
ncbi:MAG: hypothetical protein EOO98_13885 [Pedobacter sp.]|nr:MAG: hypothetical protein EOO98_13885 [Pedobacter sp.]